MEKLNALVEHVEAHYPLNVELDGSGQNFASYYTKGTIKVCYRTEDEGTDLLSHEVGHYEACKHTSYVRQPDWGLRGNRISAKRQDEYEAVAQMEGWLLLANLFGKEYANQVCGMWKGNRELMNNMWDAIHAA